MSVYIKILGEDGTAISVEELDPPVYVYKQPRNGEVVRCIETLGQGVLDATGGCIYRLYGKESIDRAVATAMVITRMEYDELLLLLGKEDGEDTEPEVPEGDPDAEILTRAELTARVKELEEELQAAKILLGVE